MKKINIASLALLLALNALRVFAQQTDDEVVKINTSVIQVDATVTDKNGVVITDLRSEDFEVYENGKRRQISGFSFVRPANAGGAATISNQMLLGAANSSAAATAPRTAGQIGRIIAIVFDDITMSKEGVDFGKKNIARFVEQQVAPNDLVAVIRTTGSIGVLQKFTGDRAQLLSSIDAIRYQPITSASGGGRFAPISVGFSDLVSGVLAGVGTAKGSANIVANRSSVEALGNALRNDAYAYGGLQVLKKTIDALGYLKGKKSVVFVSEAKGIGFSLANQNGLNDVSSNGITLANENSLRIANRDFTINNFLRVVTESANRNSVTIFPIDPSGAAATNLSAADSNRGTLGAEGNESRSSGQLDSEVRGRNDDIRQAQESLKYLARETGGKAVINKNDFGKDLTDILSAQAGFYLLAYEPDEETFDAKNSRFNKIEVKVKRPNANVSYRTGFFNVSTESKQKPSTPEDTLLQKLLVPYDFTDIGIEAASVYAAGDKNNSTIRSFVNVLPGSLTLTDDAAGAKKSATIDVFVAVFNDSGVAVGSSAKNFNISFDAKSYDNFLKSGLVNSLAFAVPKPGFYRVKVLVKDNNSGKIGTTSQTVFVPDAEKQPLSFSGFLLENFTAQQFQDLQKNPAAGKPEKMQIDTAFRHFKKGTVLTYNYALNLSPQLAKNGDARVVLTTKLLKAGQVVFTFAPEEVAANAAGGKAARRGAFNLGTQMTAGKYTLQVSAETDKTRATETQSIDFEVVE